MSREKKITLNIYRKRCEKQAKTGLKRGKKSMKKAPKNGEITLKKA
jgi:hypothetical protein